MEPLKENQIIDEYVYRVLCSHETEDGGIKNVIVNCGEQKGVQHRIRQWGDGYICGHCSELIMSACNVKVGDKIVCYQCKGSDQLERYISSKEICDHADATIGKVLLQCIMTVPPQIHELDLEGKLICKQCQKKLIYKYQGQKECKICLSKSHQLLKNLKNSLANEEYKMIKKLIILLSQKKCSEGFKAELQNHCIRKRTEENLLKEKQHESTCKIKEHKEFIEQFSKLNHKESKYSFFTKCPTHKNISLRVCPTCIAVLLNLNTCPYGCELNSLHENRVSKTKQIYETGFLVMAPAPRMTKQNKGYSLQMILVRNITIKNKLDHTEVEIKNVYQTPNNQMKESDCPRFGALASLNNNRYVLTGGLITNNKQHQITAQTWLIEIIAKQGQHFFQGTSKAPMITARSGHALVTFHDDIYAIGGYTGKAYTNLCQRFNLAINKWTSIAPLKYPRCKLTAFVRNSTNNSEVVVLGGLSTEIQASIYGEKFIQDSKEWTILKDTNISYIDQSALTHIVCSSNSPSLNKFENILLFGGSNYQDYSDSISQFQLKEDGFIIEPTSLTLISKRASSQVGVLDTSDKTRKKIVLFGGCLDHESAIDVEIVMTEIKDGKTLAPIYTDKLSSEEGCEYYRVLQCDRKKFYEEIVGLLEESGINMKQKLVKQTNIQTEVKNRQTIETLWMWGRTVANVIIEKVKP